MDRKRLLDELIDRHVERVEKPHVEGYASRRPETYVYDDHVNLHKVVYYPDDQVAHLFLVSGEVRDPITCDVSHEQRDYYVKHSIWTKSS